MAGFQKLDKKQVPQVIGLGVVSCGLFGYFAVKMITPTASAAPPAKPAAPAAPVAPAAGSASGTASSAAAGTTPLASGPIADAPAPTDSMRDPFVPLIPLQPVAPANAPPTTSVPAPITQGPTNTPEVPAANLGPLPNPNGGLAALPVGPAKGKADALAALPPAAPDWTVTGVLQSEAGQVAILRHGDVRDYARPGDMVDANFRVVDVTRSFVELRHGSQTYTLPLGGPPPDKSGKDTAAAPTANAPQSDVDKAVLDVTTGDALFAKGNLNAALAQYQQAIGLDPNNANAHIGMGNVQHAQKQDDDAVAQYNAAIKLQPNSYQAYNGLGVALRDQGDQDAATQAFTKASSIKPDDTEAEANLRAALTAQGQ